MKKKLLVLAAMAVIFLFPLYGVVADEGVETPVNPSAEEQPEVVEDAEVSEEESEQLLIYKVTVVDLSKNGKLIEDLSAKYELTSQLGIRDVVKYHIDMIVKKAEGYEVAKNYLGKDHVEIGLEEAVIGVLPKTKEVQVIHHLYGCDDKLKHVFLEDVKMAYLQELTVDTAPEIVKSLIQQVSGSGFKLRDVKVQDFEPVEYKVFDVNGNEITPKEKKATIYLYYLDSRCKPEDIKAGDESEEKEAQVDSSAETTVSEQTLPATGDKSMKVFLLSSALLGVAILLFRRGR